MINNKDYIDINAKFIKKKQPRKSTRGSQEPVITHLVFNLTSKVDRNGGVLHIILKVGHPKIISTQISEQKILL